VGFQLHAPFALPRWNRPGRLCLNCDGTRAETIFRLSATRTSPFKSAGASFQSATGSRVVRISGSNAGYTMFRGSVKSTGYPLHSPVSPSPVRHRVPSRFNWSLPKFVPIVWNLLVIFLKIYPSSAFWISISFTSLFFSSPSEVPVFVKSKSPSNWQRLVCVCVCVCVRVQPSLTKTASCRAVSKSLFSLFSS
jgi:hypothetical protein